MYTFNGFMLIFGRNQCNSVKQCNSVIPSIKKINKFKIKKNSNFSLFFTIKSLYLHLQLHSFF